jgi:hypothetical protein
VATIEISNPIQMTPAAEGGTGRIEQSIRAVYDFAVDGGAVGTINLLPAAAIPSGAVITRALLRVLTVPTSGGAATIALQIEAAGDLQAATAFNAAPFSTVGAKALGANITTTAARNIAAVIAAAALTAGKFEVIVFYVTP